MKCLIVDDSVIMRRILVNSLRAIGCTEIVEAADGEQALALCDAGIDLVLTDWNMPGMTGAEMVRSLRSNPGTASLPVIVVTSRSNKSDLAEAAGAGVNGHVLKPFTPDVLGGVIAEVLSSRDRTGTEG